MKPVIIAFILIISLPAFAKVSDERLTECYRAYPFFLDALMQISDKDFADPKKSFVRKKSIRLAFAKKPDEVRSCLADVIQYAKDEGDAENIKYVALRTSEIESIAYTSSPAPAQGDAVR